MKDMFLFKCDIDSQNAINYMTNGVDLNLGISVIDHETMTVKESEKFKKLMGKCAKLVLQATARRINQEQSMKEVE